MNTEPGVEDKILKHGEENKISKNILVYILMYLYILFIYYVVEIFESSQYYVNQRWYWSKLKYNCIKYSNADYR